MSEIFAYMEKKLYLRAAKMKNPYLTVALRSRSHSSVGQSSGLIIRGWFKPYWDHFIRYWFENFPFEGIRRSDSASPRFFFASK